MNKEIEKMLKEESPKIDILTEEMKNRYERCLTAFGIIVSDNFLDMERIDIDKKYDKDGLFYSVPYYDSEQLWESDNKLMLLVVYKIENKSSCCPLSIDMKFIDENNWGIYVYEQRGERTHKMILIEREQGEYYTHIENYSKVTLSELLER